MFIAVTGSDELNLLCCMFAKKAGHCHGIARVRNPSYSHELDFIKKQIGISAIINPEMAAAREISHLLRFPGASKIDTFAEGRVRLIKFTLTEAQATGRRGHPGDPHPAQERYPGLRRGARRRGHHPQR